MDIQFLVERLESLVVNARKLPMTNNVLLDQSAILDLLDQMRIAIPEEVRRARRIDQESERVVAHAREEAERIIAAAQEQAALLLQESSILRDAQARSDEITGKAQERAEETMRGADQYAADVLLRLRGDLERTLSIVQKSLEVLEERKPDLAEA